MCCFVFAGVKAISNLKTWTAAWNSGSERLRKLHLAILVPEPLVPLKRRNLYTENKWLWGPKISLAEFKQKEQPIGNEPF